MKWRHHYWTFFLILPPWNPYLSPQPSLQITKFWEREKKKKKQRPEEATPTKQTYLPPVTRSSPSNYFLPSCQHIMNWTKAREKRRTRSKEEKENHNCKLWHNYYSCLSAQETTYQKDSNIQHTHLPSLELSPKVIPLGVEIPEVPPAVLAIKPMESNHKHCHLSYQKLESRTKVPTPDTTAKIQYKEARTKEKRDPLKLKC